MSRDKTIIIGGGLMGSATAWQLVQQGESVLLLERQGPLYESGSSFGEARISRALGAKDDIFSYLQQTSISETKKLIEFLLEKDPNGNHSMDDIYKTSPVTYIFYDSQQDEVNQLLNSDHVRFDYADNPKTSNELFGMIGTDSKRIIREYAEYSGTLNPRVLIEKLHHAILISGGVIAYQNEIEDLTRKNKTFEINVLDLTTGERRKIKAEKIVVAAGPYTGNIVNSIAPEFKSLVQPKRVFLAFFRIQLKSYDQFTEVEKKRLHDSFPVADFNDELNFSMIEKLDQERPVLKIGAHYLRSDIKDLDTVWEEQLTPEEIEWSRTTMFEYLELLNLPLKLSDIYFVKGNSCVYSLTSSEVPYVTQIFRNRSSQDRELDKNCVVVAGMSGIGAKASLAYGLFAADLLTNRTSLREDYTKVKMALSINREVKESEKQNSFKASDSSD